MNPLNVVLSISNFVLVALVACLLIPKKELTAPVAHAYPQIDPEALEKTDRYYYGVEILRIIDGDTVEARINLGFDTHRVETLRLFGIDTPEVRGVSKEEGLKSKARLQYQLDNAEEITVRTIRDETGSFGRYLAIIYADGENLNDSLINEGLAVVYER